ncbi:MAG TPA: hypothetical protein VLS28_02535 [Candidatus Sulfomarinibacteraceae bacterium]|nr:hypothetical protein [Candidatus Sulfomarinibacteraceae bacterium]
MKRRGVLGFLLLSTLALGACSGDDRELAQAFIQEWAVDHAGEIAMHRLGLSDGDSYVDAAVDAADVVTTFQQAEDLMAKGRRSADPVAMDSAIKLRPYDWTYELSRSNLALQLGDMDGYWRNRDQVQIDAVGVPWERVDKQSYSELLAVHKRLDTGPGSVGGFASYEQCRALYDGLAITSGNLAGDPASTETRSWRQREADCDQLPH